MSRAEGRGLVASLGPGTSAFCAGCGREVTGKVVSALGMKWHVPCLKCAACHKALGSIRGGTFSMVVTPDSEPLCPTCGAQRAAAAPSAAPEARQYFQEAARQRREQEQAAAAALDHAARAQWAYAAQNADEVTLAEGDRVSVLEKFRDGWWRVRTPAGEEGVVPGNYLAHEAPAPARPPPILPVVPAAPAPAPAAARPPPPPPAAAPAPAPAPAPEPAEPQASVADLAGRFRGARAQPTPWELHVRAPEPQQSERKELHPTQSGECGACGRAVPLDDCINLNWQPFHRACFKCSRCKTSLVGGDGAPEMGATLDGRKPKCLGCSAGGTGGGGGLFARLRGRR